MTIHDDVWNILTSGFIEMKMIIYLLISLPSTVQNRAERTRVPDAIFSHLTSDYTYVSGQLMFGTEITSARNCGLRDLMLTSARSPIEMVTSEPYKIIRKWHELTDCSEHTMVRNVFVVNIRRLRVKVNGLENQVGGPILNVSSENEIKSEIVDCFLFTCIQMKNMNLKKYLKIHWIVELIEFLIFWQGLLLWWKIYQHRHQSCNWLHYQTETQLRTLSRYCLHLLWNFCMFQRVPRCNFERPSEWTIWIGSPPWT